MEVQEEDFLHLVVVDIEVDQIIEDLLVVLQEEALEVVEVEVLVVEELLIEEVVHVPVQDQGLQLEAVREVIHVLVHLLVKRKEVCLDHLVEVDPIQEAVQDPNNYSQIFILTHILSIV